MALAPRNLLHDHRYAIVGGVQAGALPEGLAVLPLVPLGLEKSAHLLPGLVDLSGLRADVLAACLEQLEADGGCHTSLFCALLRCESSITALANGLRSALIARFDGEDRYFRYFDPRVFCQLEWILDSAQYCRVFGSAASWAYPVDGEWRLASRPEVAPVLRLRFNAGVADKLDRLALINSVIDALGPLPGQQVISDRTSPSTSPMCSQGPASPASLSAHAATTALASPPASRTVLARAAYELVLAARQHGLRSDKDIGLFIRHGITLHSAFHLHPLIARRLANLDHRLSNPYQYAVSDLTEDDMQRIKGERMEREIVSGGSA